MGGGVNISTYKLMHIMTKELYFHLMLVKCQHCEKIKSNEWMNCDRLFQVDLLRVSFPYFPSSDALCHFNLLGGVAAVSVSERHLLPISSAREWFWDGLVVPCIAVPHYVTHIFTSILLLPSTWSEQQIAERHNIHITDFRQSVKSAQEGTCTRNTSSTLKIKFNNY